MAIQCFITTAAVQHFSLKAMQNVFRPQFDVTKGFSVSVCCEVTGAKWTEGEGEMASNSVLILNTRNLNKCAQ